MLPAKNRHASAFRRPNLISKFKVSSYTYQCNYEKLAEALGKTGATLGIVFLTVLPKVGSLAECAVLHHALLGKPVKGTQSAAKQQAHYLAEWTTAMILIAVAARHHELIK